MIPTVLVVVYQYLVLFMRNEQIEITVKNYFVRFRVEDAIESEERSTVNDSLQF